MNPLPEIKVAHVSQDHLPYKEYALLVNQATAPASATLLVSRAEGGTGCWFILLSYNSDTKAFLQKHQAKVLEKLITAGVKQGFSYLYFSPGGPTIEGMKTF